MFNADRDIAAGDVEEALVSGHAVATTRVYLRASCSPRLSPALEPHRAHARRRWIGLEDSMHGPLGHGRIERRRAANLVADFGNSATHP